MPIRVDAYTTGGMASGVARAPGHLREILEHDRRARPRPSVPGSRSTVAAPRRPATLTIPIDDVLVAVADDDPAIPVHASWHRIHLEVGPYMVEGELPTMPGFDPGRALTRPTASSCCSRDVAARSRAAGATPASDRPSTRSINRYAVERVEADLMLGFFFPGAAMTRPTRPRPASL